MKDKLAISLAFGICFGAAAIAQINNPVIGLISFNGRFGAVVPAVNDYAFNQISGVAACAQTPNLTGDVTSVNCATTFVPANSSITYAKIQNVAASRLLGNPTGGAAAPSEIAPGASLAFNGTAIERAALTGDITAAQNSNATALANNAVTNAKFATMVANTIKANATAGAAVPTDFAMPSCSTSTQALNYTTSTGIGCNTFGTASTQSVGTSGANVPLLNGANTWSGKQIFGSLYNQSSAAYSSTTAGDSEYDGKAFADLPVASDRGIRPSVHFISLSADQTGTNGTAAQTWFPGGGVTQYNTLASTAYFFDGMIYITRAAGTTSHSTTFLLGGTATFTSINGLCTALQTTGNIQGTSNSIRFDSAAGAVCTGTSTVATENIAFQVSGIARINGAGTVIPQFKYDVAPGGAPTILKNSYFRLYSIGLDTVLTMGNVN